MGCFTGMFLHPPYSPDIAPSDYWFPKDAARFDKSPVHFFRRNRKLLQNWIASKDESVFSRSNSKIA